MNLAEALFFAKVAKEAYSFENQIRLPDGLEVNRFIADDRTNATAFVATNERNVIVSVKGTSSLKDFLADANFLQDKHAFGNGHVRTRIHGGFLEDFLAIREDIRISVATALASSPGRSLWITGHSLGAGIASILALDMAVSGMSPSVYTFGCPRIGNFAFARAYNKYVPLTVRVAHCKDIVTRIPKLNYYHVNDLYHMDDNGRELVVGSPWGFIKGIFGTILADVDGEAIKDHFIDDYIAALEKGIQKQLARTV
jgi:triacylglycerol lipase